MPFLDPKDPDLTEALELACLDAMRGDSPGPVLATRLQRACIDVLRSLGCDNARVQATSTRSATAVRILLPAKDKTVQEVVVRLA